MTARYDSFLLRCWRRESEHRIEVAHLQSGGWTRIATLTAAAEWIDDRCTPPDGNAAIAGAPTIGEEVQSNETTSIEEFPRHELR